MISATIIEHFGPQYEMTIPMILIIKTVISIPEIFMIFAQQSSFALSMVGIHLYNVTAQAWTSTAIFMLKSMVDRKVAYLGISLFLVLTSVSQTVASQFMAFFVQTLHIDAKVSANKYGMLVTYITVITMILSVPFFYISGRRIVAKTRAEQDKQRMSYRDKVLEARRIAALIMNNPGGDFMFADVTERKTFGELRTIKAQIKNKMSHQVDSRL